MPRLFVGIALPQVVQQQLSNLQPRPMPGLRIVRAEHIHLTLHFLGEAAVEPYRSAFDLLHGTTFTMVIDILGQFSRRGGHVLWAGVREEPSLLQLHAACSAVLQTAGYRPEQRAYHPHLTLARCDSRVPRQAIDAYLQQKIVPISCPVDEVVLYRSELSSEGPRYTREAVVRLT